jgi:protease PrsW
VHPLHYLAVGFAPGLFWLWIVVRANRHRPDPVSLVVRTFLLGVAVALPVVVLEHIVGSGRLRASAQPMTLAEAAFVAFVVAGLVEEFGKFIVVRLSLDDSPYFDEPLRGLIYASAVALGFASIENVGYMRSFGVEVIVPRALLSTLAHVFFAGLWGYGLGADRRARLQGERSRGFAVLGLAGAVVAHGMFDVMLFMDQAPLAILTFLVTGTGFAALLVRANRRSIHRGRTVAPYVACGHCQARSSPGKRFCGACGGALARDLERRCGGCDTPLGGPGEYCASCGVRLAEADA